MRGTNKCEGNILGQTREFFLLFEKHTHTYIGEGGWDKEIHSHATNKRIWWY